MLANSKCSVRKSKLSPSAYDSESIETREKLRFIKEKVNVMKSTSNPLNSTISKDSLETKEILESIGLGIYFKTFMTNKMVGSLFFDLTDIDLDYMNIRVLAHRKAILKVSRELRSDRNKSREDIDKGLAFKNVVLEWRLSKDDDSLSHHTNSQNTWSRKVTTLRQDVEESREAGARKGPSTSDSTMNAIDSEDQEHQVTETFYLIRHHISY